MTDTEQFEKTVDEANPYEKSRRDFVSIIEGEIQRRTNLLRKENARYRKALEQTRDYIDGGGDYISIVEDIVTKALGK